MEFLRLLESIRFPALNGFMSAVTFAGDEMAFMAVALLVFWCVSKRVGYYIFLVDFMGTVITQIMKLLFRVPRPWMLDPDFTIVESARAAANDYSFPSGHTLNAVGTWGTLAVAQKQKWLRLVCGALIVLIPFSRMYLGVHTPKDVLAAFVVAVVLIVLFRPMFRTEEQFRKNSGLMLALMIVFSLILVCFMEFWKFPADVHAEFVAGGKKNAYTITGAVLGLLVVFYYDKKYLNFDTKAPFAAQVLKYVLGMAILFGLKEGLKAAFIAIGFTGPLQSLVRYFILVAFAGCVWPRTFPVFSKLAEKRENA